MEIIVKLTKIEIIIKVYNLLLFSRQQNSFREKCRRETNFYALLCLYLL